MGIFRVFSACKLGGQGYNEVPAVVLTLPKRKGEGVRFRAASRTPATFEVTIPPRRCGHFDSKFLQH